MKTTASLPNLIIPGAGKSGTSSLHSYLNIHPDIYMSERKEPFFFSHDDLYNNRKEWYINLFSPGKGRRFRGESSTSYFASRNAVERMKKDLKDPKFIILLRNPIDRIVSQYFWLKGKGLEHRNFNAALKYDADFEIDNDYHIFNHGKCYLQFSFYSKWVKNYIDVFGSENVLIITTESLKNKPLKTLNKCFSFLELKNIDRIGPHLRENKTIYKDVPKWDAFILYLLLSVNNRSLFFRVKEYLVPGFVKNLYWTFHEWYNKKRIMEKKPEITSEQRKKLKLMLEDDVEKLKKLTLVKFEEWKDFSDI